MEALAAAAASVQQPQQPFVVVPAANPTSPLPVLGTLPANITPSSATPKKKLTAEEKRASDSARKKKQRADQAANKKLKEGHPNNDINHTGAWAECVSSKHGDMSAALIRLRLSTKYTTLFHDKMHSTANCWISLARQLHSVPPSPRASKLIVL
jgi:hypothetical protein